MIRFCFSIALSIDSGVFNISISRIQNTEYRIQNTMNKFEKDKICSKVPVVPTLLQYFSFTLVRIQISRFTF